MTRNQIEYWAQKENARHNLATETETNRSNVVRESETERHNRAGEGETNRHNVVTEGIDLGKLNESIRHNKETEYETRRHNVAGETETRRHNVTTEGIDLSKLSETTRHNRATEAVGSAQVSLGYANLGELAQHNRIQERIGLTQANAAVSKVEEAERHNRALEGIQQFSAISNAELNSARSDLARTDAKWEEIKGRYSQQLTSSQIKQIDALIAKTRTETAKLSQDMNWKTYEEVLKGVDTISRVMSALDDFQRGVSGFTDSSSSGRRYDKYLDSLLEEIRNE